jgi:hypothetical protein
VLLLLVPEEHGGLMYSACVKPLLIRACVKALLRRYYVQADRCRWRRSMGQLLLGRCCN